MHQKRERWILQLTPFIVQLCSKYKNLMSLQHWACFFKLLPISNTGDSTAYILATVHFLYPKLGSFFRHGALLLPTCLQGLESRIKSNAVLSLFWLELGQPKWPLCMLVSAKPTTSARAGSLNHNLRERRGGCAPFEPPSTGGHPF